VETGAAGCGCTPVGACSRATGVARLTEMNTGLVVTIEVG
jgi:hypothetical protein